SVSSSRTGWSCAIVSPGLTRTRRTSPAVTFSPSSGSLKSITRSLQPALSLRRLKSRNRRVPFLRIDVVRLDRLLRDGGFDEALSREGRERRDNHVPVVHLEKIAQARAAVAPAESVGAERGHPPRQPTIDRVGQRLDVIGSRHEDPWRLFQALRHVWLVRRLPWMEHVPAFAGVSLAVQLAVAGHAPHIRTDAILRFEDLLGL